MKRSKCKLFKAVIDAGLTCPNIDGTIGKGGCIFCNGGGYFTHDSSLSITDQLSLENKRINGDRNNRNLIAYFQAHTNTYCSPEKLNDMLSEATKNEVVKEISVATRPDCLEDDKIDILSYFNQICPVTVELGLQTKWDKTAEKINRCYKFEKFENAFEKLKANKLRICVHLIDGLPNETEDMMIESAYTVGRMKPEAIKIHLLHIIRGTELEEMYLNNGYQPMTMDDYTDVVISQLEVIPPEIVIERITGDGDKKTLVAPKWSGDKKKVIAMIDKKMSDRDTWQGKRLQ
jgi:radical SAM protein (TIGR01212 family)